MIWHGRMLKPSCYHVKTVLVGLHQTDFLYTSAHVSRKGVVLGGPVGDLVLLPRFVHLHNWKQTQDLLEIPLPESSFLTPQSWVHEPLLYMFCWINDFKTCIQRSFNQNHMNTQNINQCYCFSWVILHLTEHIVLMVFCKHIEVIYLYRLHQWSNDLQLWYVTSVVESLVQSPSPSMNHSVWRNGIYKIPKCRPVSVDPSPRNQRSEA